MVYTLEQGQKVVKLARRAITSVFEHSELKIPKEKFLDEKKGCFVTLHLYPNRELRGCIGIVEPVYSLSKAVVESARSSAFSDYRFEKVGDEELKDTVIEVSVLSVPEQIKFSKPEELFKKIDIGKDGLIVEFKNMKGLLLPIVAVEYNWDAEEFVKHTCEKAGLPEDSFKKPGFKIWKFQTEVFSEEKPDGKVIKKI